MREPSKCKCGSTTFRVFLDDFGSVALLQCTDCGALLTEDQLRYVVHDSPQPVEENIERIETDEYIFTQQKEA